MRSTLALLVASLCGATAFVAPVAAPLQSVSRCASPAMIVRAARLAAESVAALPGGEGARPSTRSCGERCAVPACPRAARPSERPTRLALPRRNLGGRLLTSRGARPLPHRAMARGSAS